MARKQMWAGIPTSHMQWVPQPLIDSSVSRSRHVETVKFENGGGDIYRSKPYQMVYNLEVFGDAHDLEGIDAYNKIASGFYGDGLFHMAYPPTYETNLFPAHWASPGMIEQGWPNIYTATPTFSNTAANSYNQPPRSATWDTSTATVDAPPTGEAFSVHLPVPPGYRLHVGWTGSATGDGRVQFLEKDANGVAVSSVTNVTPSAATSATRMSTFFDPLGGSVQVWIGRASAVASTVTVTSMMAQLYKSTVTPVTTGNHVPGEGHTGLDFADDAAEETYSYLYPPKKGLSTSLIEVGAWR